MSTHSEVPMFRCLILFFVLLGLAAAAEARVELFLPGHPSATIDEVYLHDGIAYLAVDDVLASLGMSGQWDSVEHIYRIKSPAGTALISPGSHYLRLGERYVPLSHPPRFIDGRLRIAENFIKGQLPVLVGGPVYYRNLNPPREAVAEEQGTLDQLFAFLLRKAQPDNGPALRAVAIDPGHGGDNVGALGPGGSKEKVVTLEVARRLEKQLKMQLGIPIYLSRDGDYSLTPVQRLEAAARPDVDVLIQLHVQASFGPAPRGVTLIVRPQEETADGALPRGEGGSIRLARFLAAALRSSGVEVAGILQAPLLPLGRGNLPTVLVELGYLTNSADRDLLHDPAGQEKLAGALFAGLKNYMDALEEVPR
jgi:N-acetylmuramoyl-L-alanine amidase